MFMLCVPEVDGVENEESMWKHSPKSKAPSQVRLPQFGIVQATNPSCLLYFP